jgi:hypothetical protein
MLGGEKGVNAHRPAVSQYAIESTQPLVGSLESDLINSAGWRWRN